MIDKYPNWWDEMYNFIFKIFVPSFVAISIKVATQVKNENVTFLKAILSFIIGVGCAYFTYPFVDKTVEIQYIPLIVGVVSISGEKIAEYLIYKFNIDLFITAIVDALRTAIIKMITK